MPDQTQVVICQKWVVVLPGEDGIEEIKLEHLVIIYEVEEEDWWKPRHRLLELWVTVRKSKKKKWRTEICHSAPTSLTTKILCLEDHSMEYSCDVWRKMKLFKLCKKYILECRSHQFGLKLYFLIKRMGYYCQLWWKIVWIMLEDVKLVSCMQMVYISHLKRYTRLLHLGHLTFGD